ncbi:MAG: hypothetical protein A2015_08935 [Spirochaetes bacterium GWF1_31_7]|nr:MAG: hypothetical protein A2Y30_06725 [Spirochaetes bacterium GWE1_32_154]OHD48045.1 MAG: hypothetical protein A2015_08935 [Spirochaetes bacterium GWF1_31_7]OHD49638.1 MAG: hypothetical protein A2Y29_06700 [Spirochaetes bacterium GWE2_31_10]OHD81732.1 MAG: hypothetical protein A2355_07495 [Spirochaetes bacterium RIFOXYB1_FULL_32_8]HBD96190.1 hypothetical protein [Spirochaetia bacterium]
MNRTQSLQIINDLTKKIVFITGPRQVGKTYLARDIAAQFGKSLYLNYDSYADRKIIDEQSWLPDTKLIIFDELHKKKDWKNYLKGVFDTRNEDLMILVTGSSRLDAHRSEGDSLLGRYFLHRLLPFSVREIADNNIHYTLDHFLERGGYPEPFLSESTIDADRWRQLYIDGIIQTDVLDFETIHNIKSMRLLLDMLRNRVGSPLSFNNLAQDLQIAPNTVRKYIEIFEALYIVFRVTPFSDNIARSLLKEPKVYFYDNGLVSGDDGAKLENFTAVSLLKHCYYNNDVMGRSMELRYIRTKDGREVDFCITDNGAVNVMIEVKNRDTDISPSLLYFKERYDFPAAQLVRYIRNEHLTKGIEVRDAYKYFLELNL